VDENDREDEWFRRHEQELLVAAREAREKRERERLHASAQEENARLKQLHFMRCPKCGQQMAEEQLAGVTVDRCSSCEGIFFDAGELEQALMKKSEDRKGFFRKLVKL
jgi:hypothetical protein